MGRVPTADPHSPAEATRRWQMPRLATDDRMVGGVAAGIADELGLDPMVVRVAFAVLAVAGGWGVVLYAGAWAVDGDVAARAIGGPSTRQGAEPHPSSRSGSRWSCSA